MTLSGQEAVDMFEAYLKYYTEQVKDRREKLELKLLRAQADEIRPKREAQALEYAKAQAEKTALAAKMFELLLGGFIRETARGFKEMGSSGPVVLPGDRGFVCTSKGNCPVRVLEDHGHSLRIQYESPDCFVWTGLVDGKNMLADVPLSTVVTEADYRAGRFICPR
jgi:hypothetical protein